MPINYRTNNITSSGNINVSGIVTATSGVFSNLTVGGSSFNSAVSGLLPIIANSGDNRVLTSTGSSVGIYAENNLTFDGTNLVVVSGDATIGGLKALKWNGNTWGYDKIIFRSDVNNKITSDSSGNYNWLVVGKNWTLSDVGNVGIGTLSPSGKIHVNGSAVFGPDSGMNSGVITLRGDSATGGDGLYSINLQRSNYSPTGIAASITFGRGTGGSDGEIRFSTHNGTSLAERMRLSQFGSLGVGTTAPSGRLNVIGTGLFSTTTGIAPNALLDLYSATSGDMVFNVEGTNGSLFSVIDNLSGTLMSVNNNAGLPVFEVFSDDRVVGGRYNQNDFAINSSGNIGIGNSGNNSYKLNVSGTGNFVSILENANRVKNKTLTYFTPLNNNPPASGFATLDTRNSIAVLDFDDTSSESGMFIGILPENAALSSGLSVRIHWMATSATSGICRWGIQFEKMTTDLDADSFDTTVSESGSSTNATNGIPTITEISCTGLDSLAGGDLFRILVYRDSGDTVNDTMTGDAELLAVELRSIL